MKIELVDRKTAKITLTEKDLDAMSISYEDMDYKNPETKRAILELIERVKEETGLCIARPRLCGVVHWCDRKTGERRIIFLYRASEFTGSLIGETREGPVFWMDLEKMVKSPHLSDGIPDYLKLFLQEENSEAFACCQDGVWDGFEIL